MRFIARTTLALVLMLGCTTGNRSPTLEAAALAVRSLVARYDSAWAAKDTAVVAGILAPNYVYFTSTGQLSSRSEALTLLTDTTYHLSDALRSDVELTVAGPVVRVSSRWQGHGRFQGAPVDDDQTCGQLWVWEAGQWRLLSEHCANRVQRDSAQASGS